MVANPEGNRMSVEPVMSTTGKSIIVSHAARSHMVISWHTV
jgi:hypothetical protein